MAIRRLENIGMVVDDLDAAESFFVSLGLARLGATTVEGAWVDRVLGLDGVRCEIVLLQTSDGHGRLEIMRFLHPAARPGERDAPPHTHGLRRLAFDVDDLDATLAAARAHGAELIGEVQRYEDAYRLCYLRGPEGIIVMLSEELGAA